MIVSKKKSFNDLIGDAYSWKEKTLPSRYFQKFLAPCIWRYPKVKHHKNELSM